MVLRKKAKGKAKGVEQDIINVENTPDARCFG